MAAGPVSTDEGLTSINITPMVDVVLVLLVIFMVTTSVVQQLEGMDIDRPDAASGETLADAGADPIVVTCRANGALELDGAPIRPGKLAAALAERNGLRDGRPALVACDEVASVATLVHVLDELRAAGVRRYAIVTEPPEPTAP